MSSLLALFLVVHIPLVFAQPERGRATLPRQVQPQDDRDAAQERNVNPRAGSRKGRRSILQETKQEKQRELRETAKERRENHLNRLHERREAQRVQHQERRVAVRERIEQFQNERRRRAAVRLHEKLEKVNEHRVAVMRDHLLRLEVILGKIDARAERAQQLGRDVPVDLSTAARAAIATAWDALDSQAEQSYSAEFTDEEDAHIGFGTTIQKIKRDLQTVHAVAIAAQRAVTVAAGRLHAVPNVNDEENLEGDTGGGDDAP